MDHRIRLVAGTTRDTRKLRIFCVFAVASWTLPQAAYCLLRFDPWLAPGLFTSSTGLPVAVIAGYALLGVLAPMALLACGASVAAERGGWRWLVSWAIMLALGLGYEGFALLGLKVLGVEMYDPARQPWIMLGSAAVFVVLALTLASMLADSPRAVLAGAGAGVRRSARTAVGRAAAAGAAASLLVLLALAGAGLRAGLARPGASVPAESTVDAIAFSSDGGSIAVADDSGPVTIAAVDPGNGVPARVPPYTVPSTGTSPHALAFSPGGHVLAVGGISQDGHGEVELWDTVTRHRLLSLADPDPQAPVRALAFSADGTVVAAGDDSGVAFLWDARTGAPLARLGTAQAATAGEVNEAGIDTLALSPDGSLLAAVTPAGGVILWRTATGKEAGSTLVPSAIGTDGTWAGGTDAIAFSENDDYYRLTIAVGRRGVYQWDAGTGRVRALVTWPTCQSCFNPVVLSPDGRYALVAGTTARLWDLSRAGVVKAWADPAGYPIDSVALSPAGPVAFGDADGGPLVAVTFPPAAYIRH
jgi:hypothetical protein